MPSFNLLRDLRFQFGCFLKSGRWVFFGGSRLLRMFHLGFLPLSCISPFPDCHSMNCPTMTEFIIWSHKLKYVFPNIYITPIFIAIKIWHNYHEDLASRRYSNLKYLKVNVIVHTSLYTVFCLNPCMFYA